MRVLRPSLSGVLRSPAALLLLTSIVPVSVLAQECTAGNAPHGAWLYDVTDEAHPRLISEDPADPARTRLNVPDGFNYTWDTISGQSPSQDTHCGIANPAHCRDAGVYPPSLTPQDPPPDPNVQPPLPNVGKNSFCNQGGRFGAHSSTELFYPPYYGKLAIVSWFVGGVRVFDIRNPDAARPIAYFIPAPNDTGCGPRGGPSPGPGCTFANTGRDNHMVNTIHTNNVELDDRGYIYIADRAGTGMHILRLTGEARWAVSGDADRGEQEASDDHPLPDYPPYGSHVPTAHFDHTVRPQLIPPPPKMMCPVLSASCTDVRPAQSAWNMELVGYDTLDGRSTYQPLVVRQGNRYIAYMAHHAGTAINRLTLASETNGTSILDVTYSAHPVYLAHIPGPGGSLDAAGNQMAHVCSGDILPSNTPAEAARKHGHYYLLRSNGNSSGSANPGAESHQIFDVTDPAHPVLLTTVAPQLTNTHKNWWECDTGIAFLVANDSSLASPRPGLAPGWHQSGSNQHVKIYNLHDPANPEYIRDFGFVGQQPNVGDAVEGLVSPPTGIHGPISAGKEKNRVYLPYGVGSNAVVEIVDREELLTGCTAADASAHCATSPMQQEMLAPQRGWFTLPGLTLQGGHTSFPIFGEEDGKPRNLLLVVSED